MVSFPPFRLDVGEERLWRGAKLLTLRRKPFAILNFLVANPKRLITHDELMKHVWGDTVVSESAVRSHLHELRQVLGDGVIETVVGRGYRFVPDVVADGPAAAGPPAAIAAGAHLAAPAPRAAAAARHVVGRDAELAALRAALDRAHAGQRQVCFVTGEPGIGKTTLVDAFVDELDDRADVIAVRGQCVEQHGAPEGYLAMIEVLGQLRRSEHGDRTLAALIRNAPTFLAQLPHLVPDAQLAEVQRRAGTGSDARTVRELVEALETLATDLTIVIVLEDVQWSDIATVDLLGLLGQRRERARLMVIATSRRAEAQTVTHPLNRVMRNLVARSGAVALSLDRIERADVARLVDLRFPDHRLEPAFTEVIDRITGGTPLFLTSMLDDLVVRGKLVQRDGHWALTASITDVAAHRPDTVKQMIDIQLDRLALDEQRALEVASVIGLEFPTALVAAALETSVETIDDRLDQLASRGLFVRRTGSEDWPDGTVQTRFAMIHGLVLEVCRDRSPTTRRQRWHRLIATHLDAAFGGRSDDMAQTLAVHYDLGQVPADAVRWYLRAAERSQQRHASRDALQLYRRGLEVLRRLPEGPDRDRTELRFLTEMSPAVLRVGGEAGRASLADFERAVALARRLGDPLPLYGALVNLAFRLGTLGQHRRVSEVCGEYTALGSTMTVSPNLAAYGEAAGALAMFWQGQLTEALAVLERLLGPSTVADDGAIIGVLGPTDQRTLLLTYRSLIAWMVGRTDRGIADALEAIERAEAARDPFMIGLSHTHYARMVVLCGGRIDEARERAELVQSRPELEVWHGSAAILLGWFNSQIGALDLAGANQLIGDLRARIAALPVGRTFLSTLVTEALQRAGHAAGLALPIVDEMLAFAHDANELVYEPELLRVRGEILELTDPDAAAACYRDAKRLAAAIGATMIELRATVRLARLLRGSDPAVVRELERLVATTATGGDAIDVREARAVLAGA